MSKETTIQEMVHFGLDIIDPNETINVNLRDLLLIYKSVEEFNRFFHQPRHYPDMETVHKYIGDKDSGAYAIIHDIYYHVFDRMLPENIKEIVENDNFLYPEFPFYYKK